MTTQPPSKLIKRIRAVLEPELLKADWRERLPEGATKSWGCCYCATEALYHLWGKENGYTPMRVSYRVEKHAQGTHWFLEQRASGLQVDVTADQFTNGAFYGDVPDFKAARPCGFLTKKPSKRAQKIIDAVLAE